MSNTTADQPRWNDAHRHFFSHLAHMPGWHKAVILLAGLIAAAGTVGQITGRVAKRDTQPQHVAGGNPTAPAGSNGFVANTGGGPAAPQGPASEPELGLLGRISPHATKVGLSIVLGFIVGWLFRAFLKTMALIALLIGAAAWALSHYGIMHLSSGDVQAARESAAGAATWLEAHGAQLKDLALSHLPSSGGGAFGAFLGFRRR
jgi:uncharacterized membrane protein (Fun14 family)